MSHKMDHQTEGKKDAGRACFARMFLHRADRLLLADRLLFMCQMCHPPETPLLESQKLNRWSSRGSPVSRRVHVRYRLVQQKLY